MDGDFRISFVESKEEQSLEVSLGLDQISWQLLKLLKSYLIKCADEKSSQKGIVDHQVSILLLEITDMSVS